MCVGLLKCSALRGGARDVLPDERILAGFEIMAAPTAELLRYLYPSLYPVSDPAGDWGRPTASGRYTRPTRTTSNSSFFFIEEFDVCDPALCFTCNMPVHLGLLLQLMSDAVQVCSHYLQQGLFMSFAICCQFTSVPEVATTVSLDCTSSQTDEV